MNDKSLGMILASVIAIPVMIICCGGGAVLIWSAIAGSVGYMSVSGFLASALTAVIMSIGILAFRRWRRDTQISDWQAGLRE